MPANYKDYPLYVYDEPAIYKDFSGGINTNPSNNLLRDNEMRDCLNMHYSSAGLMKRNGAKKLATISCEDDLFNIQGVFLITFKIPYIIIASDGRLYKGFYNEYSSINLTRLYIHLNVQDVLTYNSPTNMIKDLPIHYEELKNTQHTGFIHRRLLSTSGKEYSLNEYKLTDILSDLTDKSRLPKGSLIVYNTKYYLLKADYTKYLITPNDTKYWIQLTSENLGSYKEIIQKYYKNNPGSCYIKEIQYNNDTVVFQLEGTVNIWNETPLEYTEGEVRKYNNINYVCIKNHYCLDEEQNSLPTAENLRYFEELQYKDSLLFQNKKQIEMVTYNNIAYITTGTRFIKVYIENNDLIAVPCTPYKTSFIEAQNIGFNLLSPYPEFCLETKYDQVKTTCSGVLPFKNTYGVYTLTPICTFEGSTTEKDFLFKWEKYIDNSWQTIVSYKDNFIVAYKNADVNNPILIKKDYSTLSVTDADKFLYRVTMCNEFKNLEVNNYSLWNKTAYYNKDDYVYVTNDMGETLLYKCVKDHKLEDLNKTLTTFQTSYEGTTLWVEVEENNYYTLYNNKILLTPIVKYNQVLNESYKDYDFTMATLTGTTCQAQSSLDYKTKGNLFETIQTCSKITIDGNKMLLYDDAYNSGSWFKTKIDNPEYITERGCLSFKTTKNERVIKVINFSNNLIVFAYTENIGGSIHLVSGNGDDYSSDEYYSPYKRTTISTTISCDNDKTIQPCENYLFFKQGNSIYYLLSSELSNDVISVYSANDQIKISSPYVNIPWDDNTCISEVTEDYYALLWKEKYVLTDDGMFLEHPSMRIKLYYKKAYQDKQQIFFPWLRDESKYFASNYILYTNNKPILLYNNVLISYNDDSNFTDLETPYDCLIHFKGVDTNYPKILKLLNNINLYYYNDASSKITLNMQVLNEASHVILDSTNLKKSLQELKGLKVGDKLEDNTYKLGFTTLASKIFNPKYRFPYLIAETVLKITSSSLFTLSSITYNYTTIDTPDTTMYDTYSQIIRKKEI